MNLHTIELCFFIFAFVFVVVAVIEICRIEHQEKVVLVSIKKNKDIIELTGGIF